MTTTLHEGDSMICRSCGNDERASEGYPCVDCGRFLCVLCNMRGVVRCKECSTRHASERPPAAR